MSYLKSRNFSVPKKLIESLSEVLLNHCGKMVNSQCVKTALLYIQREELKQLSAHNPTIQGKPVQHQASTSRLSTKRKRASDDIKGEEPLKFQENTCRNSSWKSPGMNAVDKKICELTEKACEKMKTEALGSLNSIMELMGPKHITAVRMKVMATLKIAIHFTEEDFPQICTQAWNTFVHKLEMRRLSENQKSSFFYLSVEDENFAYDLVQELVRSFLAAEDTRIQDCASYALQETLQIYTCQSGELSQIVRPSGSLWNRFSEEVQEILVPLQHSRYIMSSNKRTSFPCPIYGSKLGSTFKDWACNWASCLLQKIYREIMAVLSHVDQAEQSKLKFHEKTDLCHLSAQTVFSILDCLTVWCHQYFVMLRSSNQNNSKPANKGKKLYILLDEPDGVAGEAASRQEDLTLHDLILGHEATGQLQDAFSCYERAVKVKPDTISHHQGLLRCLMGLDQSNTALTYATGLVNERPEWSNEINPFHVESAWKLADWDGLSEFLKSQISSDNWGVAVGKILLSVKEKENEKILEHLKIVRTQQMGPLSAASMENGAYQRGCSHVLRLHMLTDMEKAV
ncbi:serine/threonine-protein kinase atr-like isoform X3 [Tachypleus tridentatus]|uniref:serine/threonine-protein kinase atr-like isoform X3 n=1 Tax=Tachypleus tridentatus TaxID=6853 RepID=UPI003FD0433A